MGGGRDHFPFIPEKRHYALVATRMMAKLSVQQFNPCYVSSPELVDIFSILHQSILKRSVAFYGENMAQVHDG